MATELARKILDAGMGRCARFVKSLRSGKMLSHHQTAIPPVTTIESTMKKYSSGKAAARGSKFVCPRSHCRNDPYLSNRKIETKPPGMASNASRSPMLIVRPSSSPPLVPWKMRFIESRTSRGNGSRT